MVFALPHVGHRLWRTRRAGAPRRTDETIGASKHFWRRRHMIFILSSLSMRPKFILVKKLFFLATKYASFWGAAIYLVKTDFRVSTRRKADICSRADAYLLKFASEMLDRAAQCAVQRRMIEKKAIAPTAAIELQEFLCCAATI